MPRPQVSNTVCQRETQRMANGKLEVMDISPMLAESIRRVRETAERSAAYRCLPTTIWV